MESFESRVARMEFAGNKDAPATAVQKYRLVTTISSNIGKLVSGTQMFAFECNCVHIVKWFKIFTDKNNILTMLP